MAFERLIIIDDHALIRDALHSLLQSHSIAASMAAYSSVPEAIKAATAAEPPFDLALLDLGFPGIPQRSIAALEDFRLALPMLPVVVISANDDRDTVLNCLDSGAMGFVPKNASSKIIIDALSIVAAGGVFVPAHVAGSGSADGGQTAAHVDPTRAQLQQLTPRQLDVLRLMIKGLPNKLIARELQLSDNTVKAHVSAVLRAFSARNRTEAVLVASRLRLRVTPAPAGSTATA